MILFFDRSVGTTVPTLLQTPKLKLPVQVEYHESHFRIEEQDDVWLADVGMWGWTVIGQDYSYHKRPNELSAIKQYDIGCFYLWGSEASKWDYFRCFARAYDRIVEAEATTPRPFIYWVSEKGGLRSIPIP